MCNQLLEPEANEDIWKHEEAGFAGTGIQGAGVRWRSTDGMTFAFSLLIFTTLVETVKFPGKGN